jgi:excisionase family DNA binding protein
MATSYDTAPTESAQAPNAAREFMLLLPREVTEALTEHVANIVSARLNDRPEYMATDEVATYLRWPTKRIDNLCAKRRIPFHKEGGRRVFVRQEIDAWVRQLPGPCVHDALSMVN